MRTDALILGGELSGLVAAQRLLDRGKSVRLIAAGGGALHYGPGGLRLMGYEANAGESMIEDPYEAIDALDRRHPLRRLGKSRVRAAMTGFLELSRDIGLSFRSNGRNRQTVSLAGQPASFSFSRSASLAALTRASRPPAVSPPESSASVRQ